MCLTPSWRPLHRPPPRLRFSRFKPGESQHFTLPKAEPRRAATPPAPQAACSRDYSHYSPSVSSTQARSATARQLTNKRPVLGGRQPPETAPPRSNPAPAASSRSLKVVRRAVETNPPPFAFPGAGRESSGSPPGSPRAPGAADPVGGRRRHRAEPQQGSDRLLPQKPAPVGFLGESPPAPG